MSPRKERGILKIGTKRIVGIRKDNDGNISDFKLEDGEVLSLSQALLEGAKGKLKGLFIRYGDNGDLVLRSAPDGYEDGSLENLPEF